MFRFRHLHNVSCDEQQQQQQQQQQTNPQPTATFSAPFQATTVDGGNPANQLRLVAYPIIYRVLVPSQVVVWDFSHQQ